MSRLLLAVVALLASEIVIAETPGQELKKRLLDENAKCYAAARDLDSDIRASNPEKGTGVVKTIEVPSRSKETKVELALIRKDGHLAFLGINKNLKNLNCQLHQVVIHTNLRGVGAPETIRIRDLSFENGFVVLKTENRVYVIGADGKLYQKLDDKSLKNIPWEDRRAEQDIRVLADLLNS